MRASLLAMATTTTFLGATPSRDEVSALPESSSVADGRDDGRSDDRSDASDLANARTTSIARRDAFQLHAKFFDLLFDTPPLTPQHVDQVAHLRCQICFCALENVSHELRWLLRKHHTSLKEECSQLVDYCRISPSLRVAKGEYY